MVCKKIQKSNTHASDFFQPTQSMLEKLSRSEMERWAMIIFFFFFLIWAMIVLAIWKARNKLCFEDSQTH